MAQAQQRPIKGYKISRAKSIENEMELFDRLPRPVRDAVNEASVKWAIASLAKRCEYYPAELVAAALRAEEAKLANAFARERQPADDAREAAKMLDDLGL